MDYRSDIPTSTAQAAHNGTSFVPERRAQAERDSYHETLTADYAEFHATAERHGTLDLLESEFQRYREGLRKRTLAYLHSRSRLVSWMIAGPSNFPAARMNKRGDISHKRLTELLDFRQRAKTAILRTLNPSLRPIMAGDADALERLEVKLREAERLQEAMRKANVIIRAKPKGEITAEKLVDLMELGLRESRARELFEPDFCGRIGFADYALKNNNANIRRMKERIEQISRNQAAPETEVTTNGITVQDCPADNRVRLFFPGKPPVETRDKLKSHGFRWTPSLGCWQAYRNSSSLAVVSELTKA